MNTVLTFEFPLNERVRTLLRLEDLFCKILTCIKEAEPHHHHVAMLNLFQIIDVMDRGDLKNELMHDLEKHRALLAFFRSNPKIDKAKLNETLDLVNTQVDQLKSVTPKPVQELKQNDWLMAIKQRGIIPGGLCEFDAPSYHFWLNQSESKRREDLHGWLSHILPVYQALELVLNLLRGSGESQSLMADNGSYQQMLASSKQVQMARIEVDKALNCYPEISANKYAIHIRFMRMNEQRQSSTCQQEVHFKLTLASL